MPTFNLHLVLFPFGGSSNSTDGFTEWGPWSQCSRTCGSNLLRVRKRSCFKQNNQSCSGSTSEVKPCILPQCPEDFIAGSRTEAGLTEMTSSNSEFIYFTFKNFRHDIEYNQKAIYKLLWRPFRNCPGNWGEFQILPNR